MSVHVCSWPGPPDRAGQAWACPVCGTRFRAARDASEPDLVRWVRDDDRPGLDTAQRVRLSTLRPCAVAGYRVTSTDR